MTYFHGIARFFWLRDEEDRPGAIILNSHAELDCGSEIFRPGSLNDAMIPASMLVAMCRSERHSCTLALKRDFQDPVEALWIVEPV